MDAAADEAGEGVEEGRGRGAGAGDALELGVQLLDAAMEGEALREGAEGEAGRRGIGGLEEGLAETVGEAVECRALLHAAIAEHQREGAREQAFERGIDRARASTEAAGRRRGGHELAALEVEDHAVAVVTEIDDRREGLRARREGAEHSQSCLVEGEGDVPRGAISAGEGAIEPLGEDQAHLGL